MLGEIEALRRYSATATPVRDKILVYGGIFAERYSGTNAEVQSRSDAVLLDPRDPFGPGTDSLDPRDERGWHTATSLPDGTVLIAGGAYEGWSEPHDQPNAISHATLDLRYDPVTHSFAVTAAVAPRRGSHTASALADGTVLVAGGMHIDDGSLPDNSYLTIAAGHTLKDAWLYQPDKLPRGTWTTAGTMIDDRYLHTATPLPDGTVLVTGGIQASTADRTYAVLNTAELFYPNLPDLSGCNPLFSAKPVAAVASTLRRLGGSS